MRLGGDEYIVLDSCLGGVVDAGGAGNGLAVGLDQAQAPAPYRREFRAAGDDRHFGVRPRET